MTNPVDPAIERTIITLVVLIGGGTLVWHFGPTNEILAPVAGVWGAVVAYWFRLSGSTGG